MTTAAEAKQAGTFRRINIKILKDVVPHVRKPLNKVNFHSHLHRV